MDNQRYTWSGILWHGVQGVHIRTLNAVAVKVFHDPASLEHEVRMHRLALEFGAHAPFPHIFETSAQSGSVVMGLVVLELFGSDIRKLLRSQMMSDKIARLVSRQVAIALNFLHVQAKIVHLDVKPANVLYTERLERAVLADFSCAEAVGEKQPQSFTKFTVHYRPPEYFMVSQSCPAMTPAGDYWAFGCLVWEVFSPKKGQQQFEHLVWGHDAKTVREHACDLPRGGYWKQRVQLAGSYAPFVWRLMVERRQAALVDLERI